MVIVISQRKDTVVVQATAANRWLAHKLGEIANFFDLDIDVTERDVTCAAPTPKAPDAAAEVKSSTAAVTKSDEE